MFGFNNSKSIDSQLNTLSSNLQELELYEIEVKNQIQMVKDKIKYLQSNSKVKQTEEM